MFLVRAVRRTNHRAGHFLLDGSNGKQSGCSHWRRYTSRFKLDKFARMSFTQYDTQPSGLPGIVLQRTGPQHLAPIQSLLRHSFFQDEPLVTALNLSGGATDISFINDEAKLVLEQLSLVAIDEKSGEIVAAAINRTVWPQEMITWPEEIDEMKCPLTQRLARYWYTMSAKANIFSTFDVPSYFEITYLVTSAQARGKGLAELLARQSLELARKSGAAPLAVIFCTHIASARVAEKIGMKFIAKQKVNAVEATQAMSVLSSDAVYYVYAMNLDGAANSIPSTEEKTKSSAAI